MCMYLDRPAGRPARPGKCFDCLQVNTEFGDQSATAAEMVGFSDTWWWAALPATLVVGKVVLGSRRSKKGSAADATVTPLRVADEGQIFVCERVCTSSK